MGLWNRFIQVQGGGGGTTLADCDNFSTSVVSKFGGALLLHTISFTLPVWVNGFVQSPQFTNQLHLVNLNDGTETPAGSTVNGLTASLTGISYENMSHESYVQGIVVANGTITAQTAIPTAQIMSLVFRVFDPADTTPLLTLTLQVATNKLVLDSSMCGHIEKTY